MYFTVPSLVAPRVKSLPAMRETWVLSLGRENPLDKGMATHSSILAWRIPWTKEPGRLHSPRGFKELDTTIAPDAKRLKAFYRLPLINDSDNST